MDNQKLVQRKSILATAIGIACIAITPITVQAQSYGTDLNLTAHPAAGGMSGAAYTRPQEASAAVFGNPATLSQFKGINFNFGATGIDLDVENTQTFGAASNTSTSTANHYVLPTFGATLQLNEKVTLGLGFEAASGLGADYRNDPITLAGGALGTGLPLNVELLEFNVNAAGAYKVSDQLSLGAALTIGESFAQLGTAGPTTGLGAAPLTPAVGNFGGTTSSTHDLGVGISLGSTYNISDKTTLSAAWKSETAYKFRDILYQDLSGLGGAVGFQDLEVELPQEFILGVASEGTVLPGLLLEADAIYKNWDDAKAFGDAWDDQWVLALGGQYSIGKWKLRGGYSYAENMIKENPNSTLDTLTGLGTVPLGPNSPVGPAVGSELVGLVQTTLLPTIWEHGISAGVGYKVNKHVSLDGFVGMQFGESFTRSTPTTNSTLTGGAVTAGTTFEADIDDQITLGVGINVSM